MGTPRKPGMILRSKEPQTTMWEPGIYTGPLSPVYFVKIGLNSGFPWIVDFMPFVSLCFNLG